MAVAPGIAILALLALVAPARVHGQAAPIRGFSAAASERQAERERRLRALPQPDRVRQHIKVMSAEPHVAGTPASRAVADYAAARFREYGLEVWVEEHHALMPFPRERLVEIVGPEPARLLLQEPAMAADPDSGDAGQVPTFNAYSADGDVTAEIVYVNYGTPDDFARLERLGVSVTGKIVLARYGQSWRGIKPKVAQEHGAVGCLIYSDPRDDGFWRGPVYPEGAWRPEHGVQRGSVMDMPVHPGDPLTPGWGGEASGRRLDRAEAKNLLKIPVLPISHGDALPILRQMHGPVAPEEWRGALPVTYRIGPGPAQVRLALSFDWQIRPLYNVMAKVTGSTWPDEWVMYGNHHDAWVNGAMDPVSGAAALLETARAVGQLAREGWRPKRTLVFALWDGEEWGLLGSTEWAETHAARLREQAVVYINTDSNGRGSLNAGGSHALEALVNDVTAAIPDPRSGRPLREEVRARRLEQARDADRRALADSPWLHLGALGSGSDYTVFLDHLTVASLNLGFGGDSPGGVYHSIYDSFEWYSRFADTDFTYGATLAGTVGTLMLRLGDADVLPFAFTSTAETLSRYVDEVQQAWRSTADAPVLDFGPLWSATGALRQAADAYEVDAAAIGRLAPDGLLTRRAQVQALNRLLYTSERLWAHPAGLPGRDWFKHQLYAPGSYTGYGVKTLPGIREAVEQRRWDEAAEYLRAAAAATDLVAARVRDASAALRALVAP
jgi:N-acetylated-alpha-linked acidic dipeptidase